MKIKLIVSLSSIICLSTIIFILLYVKVPENSNSEKYSIKMKMNRQVTAFERKQNESNDSHVRSEEKMGLIMEEKSQGKETRLLNSVLPLRKD